MRRQFRRKQIMKRSLLWLVAALGVLCSGSIGWQAEAVAAAADECRAVGLSADSELEPTNPNYFIDRYAFGLNGSLQTPFVCKAIRVQVAYNELTHHGQENFSIPGLLSGTLKARAEWDCSADPWTSLDAWPSRTAPTCSRTFVTRDRDFPAEFFAVDVYPLSAGVISDADRSALQSQRDAARSRVYHAPALVDGWPLLDVWSQGEAVRSAGYLLIAQGRLFLASGQPDTLFDPFSMQNAIVAFQANTPGLPHDGVVGPATWQALIIPIQQGDEGPLGLVAKGDQRHPAVLALQSQLKSRGVDIEVDGFFGDQTDAAVRDYQSSHGLTVDGVVGPETWQSLLAGT